MKIYIINPLYTFLFSVIIFAALSSSISIFNTNGKTYLNTKYEIVYGGHKTLTIDGVTTSGLKSYRLLTPDEQSKILKIKKNYYLQREKEEKERDEERNRQRILREAEKEKERKQREIERQMREAEREMERQRRDAERERARRQRDAEREKEQQRREVEREMRDLERQREQIRFEKDRQMLGVQSYAQYGADAPIRQKWYTPNYFRTKQSWIR